MAYYSPEQRQELVGLVIGELVWLLAVRSKITLRWKLEVAAAGRRPNWTNPV
jgi:hypothetical protein